jgi:hypothetical protein
VVVWLVLAVLVGAIVVIERADLVGYRSERSGDDPRRLLPVPVDQLGAIEIASAGRLHRFERDGAGAWLYHGDHAGAVAAHTHAADPALSQRIGVAFAAFGRTRIEHQLTCDRDGKAYGVATPQIVVLLYRPRESQPIAQLAVGDVAPDTVSRYVELVGSATVVTIPSYQIDNLLTLIEAAGPSATR